MKTLYTYIIFCFIFTSAFACTKGSVTGKENSYNTPDTTSSSLYPWEEQRTETVKTDDLVLLYSGGVNRTYGDWNRELVSSYLTYTDPSGHEHWLFDGFLFLEIFDKVKRLKFATGYEGEPALQKDWQYLIDHYFSKDKCLHALEAEIEKAIKRLGAPVHKHRIVISIPEPISSVQNWGTIDGKSIDFTVSDDERMKAVKWYIDYTRRRFHESDFQHIELAGFYWVAETATHTRTIIGRVASYLDKLNYSFNWIPYWNSDGYKDWKTLQYDFAYLQPNYYFNDAIEISRLEEACKAALQYDMDMEVEFDESALSEGLNRGYRLKDYLNAFREFGIIERKRLAYYQGGTAIHLLKESTNEESIKLYHEICQFILDHRANMRKLK